MSDFGMLIGEVALAFAIGVLVDMGGHYKIQLAYSASKARPRFKAAGFLTKPALRHGVLLVLSCVVVLLSRDESALPSSPLAIFAFCLLVIWSVLLFRDSLRELRD